MLNILVNSGIFWAIMGVIVALIIAICVAKFPLDENFDKKNRKKLICILSIVLFVFVFIFFYYAVGEYKNYSSEKDKITTTQTTKQKSTKSERNSNDSDKNTNTTLSNNNTSTSFSKKYIEDKYNKDGILVNGAFGQQNYYKGFYKYDVNKQQFENFDISQVNCDYNKVKLIFIDEKNNIIDKCSVFVGVPESYHKNSHDSACLYNDTDFNSSDVVYFETGIYKFEITKNNKEYYSDFLTIDDSKTYYINLKSIN